MADREKITEYCHYTLFFFKVNLIRTNFIRLKFAVKYFSKTTKTFVSAGTTFRMKAETKRSISSMLGLGKNLKKCGSKLRTSEPLPRISSILGLI